LVGIAINTYGVTYPNVQLESVFYGNIQYGYVDYRIIVWYPVLAKNNYNIIISIFNLIYNPPSYAFSVGFNPYKEGFSIFFMALKAF